MGKGCPSSQIIGIEIAQILTYHFLIIVISAGQTYKIINQIYFDSLIDISLKTYNLKLKLSLILQVGTAADSVASICMYMYFKLFLYMLNRSSWMRLRPSVWL